jgi:NAD(P)H-hydrate epimerase
MPSDSGASEGEVAHADATVTFTAPKLCHVLPPNCDATGELRVAHIGSPASLMRDVKLHLTEPADFRHLLAPRERESNKGTYGHVLVCGGAAGKTGAAEMAGVAALRSGAGLVTVASSAERYNTPELMTAPLPGSYVELERAAERMNVIAIGPGLGTGSLYADMVHDAVASAGQTLVIDADGVNALAGRDWRASESVRILTPHPGEMSRLIGISTKEVQADRLIVAGKYAAAHGCILVLKGYRTVISLPDGRAWINPTGTPALATGGTGDVLTGMIAGLVAQFRDDAMSAVLAAVYLHGLAAQQAERRWTERCFIATDLLECLPEAMRECSRLSDKF